MDGASFCATYAMCQENGPPPGFAFYAKMVVFYTVSTEVNAQITSPIVKENRQVLEFPTTDL